jgi:hypothetical protein
MRFSTFLTLAALPAAATSFAFVSSPTRSSTDLKMMDMDSSITIAKTIAGLEIDQNVIAGAGIAIAGTVAGIGLVAFTETQGERAKERGGGVSASMATRISGSLLEDVEVSTVADLGSLTSKLENALKQSGGVNDDKMRELEMTDEEKQRVADDLDDGW